MDLPGRVALVTDTTSGIGRATAIRLGGQDKADFVTAALTDAASAAGRTAAPEEIAAVIAYLASDDTSFIQGAVLPADGGRSAV